MQIEIDSLLATLKDANSATCAEAALKLGAIAESQAQAENIEIARNTIAATIEFALKIENKWRQARVLGVIVLTQTRVGDIEDALETSQIILDEGRRVEALTAIAEIQVQTGETESARDTLIIALETAQNIDDKWQRSNALRAIAEVQARAGEIEVARSILAVARKTGLGIMDKVVRAKALGTIAETQAQVGAMDAALDTAQQIGDKKQKVKTLRAIAIVQAHAGTIGVALDTARKIKDKEQRLRTIAAIAETQAQAGDIEGALDTAQEIVEEGQRDIALRAVAEVQARAGEFEVALEINETIADKGQRDLVLGAIAETQARAGNKEAALVTAQNIKNASVRLQALEALLPYPPAAKHYIAAVNDDYAAFCKILSVSMTTKDGFFLPKPKFMDQQFVAGLWDRVFGHEVPFPYHLRLSIAHPRYLAKGFGSPFIVTSFPPGARESVIKQVAGLLGDEQFAEKVTETHMHAGIDVVIEPASHDIDFEPPKVASKLTDEPNVFTFLSKPKMDCRVGDHPVNVLIKDQATEHILESILVTVRVVDYAFDHISRPMLSRVGTVILGITSILMYLLTLLEQIDKTTGLASGTAFFVLAAVGYAQFRNLYQTVRSTSNPSP